MKYLIILATLLFSTPLLADSTFLSGLDFAKIYESKGNNEFNLIAEKGISVENFINKIKDSESSLGEKVALLNALSSYYEWKDKPKGNFEMYQQKYISYLKTIYKQDISPQNEALKSEVRLLLQLMADFDTASPKAHIYQMLAEKMPNSLTAQSVSVYAFAYDILYNEKNDFANIQNLKNNYLKPYFDNLENFEYDVPVEVKTLLIDEFLPYTFDCEGRLKCLVDTSTEKSTTIGLNELSDTIKKNMSSGTKISNYYSSDWVDTKNEAVKWTILNEKNIDKLKATDLQKAEMSYFFNSKLFELMHNIDYLSVRFLESSLLEEMNKSKSKCKTDAKCAANAYLKSIESNLEKKGITKNDIEQLFSAKNNYETAFQDKSSNFGVDAVAGGSDEKPRYNFESSFDTLHFLIIYFYNSPEKIGQMYDLE
jgi:hypothetical protein